MARRLSSLLVVAALSGIAAGAAVGEASPIHARPALVPALVPPAPAAERSASRCPIPERYRSAFELAARDAGVPLALLTAVGEVESNLRHDAVSPAGATGLLQLMPATAAELQLDPTRPSSNVLAGARYLRLLLDRFQSADLALAAYNAGPTAVEQAGSAPNMTTVTYVANVTARWRELAGCR